MLSLPSVDIVSPIEQRSAGALLRARNTRSADVLYLERGRVALGIRESTAGLRHQLGLIEGPAWLDAAFALRRRSCALDMIAQGGVQLRRVALGSFEAGVLRLSPLVRGLVNDLAQAYCQQTDMALGRLLQDAQARCAQWLLQHARVGPEGSAEVLLDQRKRLIAAQLGIAPETLSRVLRQLREQGLIAGRGTLLRLPQPAALQLLVA